MRFRTYCTFQKLKAKSVSGEKQGQKKTEEGQKRVCYLIYMYWLFKSQRVSALLDLFINVAMGQLLLSLMDNAKARNSVDLS